MASKYWQDACGVFGYFDTSCMSDDAAEKAYFGLFALQHRGQASAGIVTNCDGRLLGHKDQGLVLEVFDDMSLRTLAGHASLGHVRYPTQGSLGFEAIGPMQIKSKSGPLALSVNGALTNAVALRDTLKENGAIFQTSSDMEVMLALLARNRILAETLEDAIIHMMKEVTGAYAAALLSDDCLIGIRDPLGIRPLVLGKKDDAYVLASESCALDAIGATLCRDIAPGEIITISEKGIASRYFGKKDEAYKQGRVCLFEYVYFGRPDSVMDGASIYESRLNAGKILAHEAPCACDLVVGAPDSGMAAAMGYAMESKLPLGAALLKNRYVARTFIQPTQMRREIAVKMKFSVLRSSVKDKSIILVDDSIIRGTTTRHLIMILKAAGAKEVHMRVASPPVCHPCYYGIDTPTKKELKAASASIEEVRQHIGADSLAYISLEGLKKTTHHIVCGHCSSCFDGAYPAGVPDKDSAAVHQIMW